MCIYGNRGGVTEGVTYCYSALQVPTDLPMSEVGAAAEAAPVESLVPLVGGPLLIIVRS